MEETKEMLQRILDTLERIEDKLEPKNSNVSLMLDSEPIFESTKRNVH